MNSILVNFSLIYFIYGLAFFSMGLTILVEILRSGIRGARDLFPLAVFGIVHGMHEWLELALILERSLQGNLEPIWELIRTGLLALSFIALIGYGVRVLSAQSKKRMNDLLIGGAMLVIYLVSLLLAGAIPAAENPTWVITADTLARFILASPGALITSLALSFQAQDFLQAGRTQISKDIRGAGIGFGFYGITQFLGPLLKISSEAAGNSQALISYPMPTVRALLAVIITFNIIRMTQSLEKERRQALEKAQIERMQALETVQREMQVRNDLRRELLRRTVILQEEERTRISRELHDDTAQILTAFNANLAALKLHVTEDESAQTILSRLTGLADRMADSIHKLVRDLRPAQLDELGIHAALAALIEQNQELLGMQVDFVYNRICDRLDPLLETVIYRIVQESLTNSARYSGCQTAEVRLVVGDSELSIQIIDQGEGFDPADKIKAGFGLMGLEERTQSLGGEFTVTSSPGQGTIVQAVFPLEEDCAEEVDHD